MNKLLTLRQLTALPLLCLLLLSGKLYGAPQQDKITLSLKEVSLTQFFKEIENKSTYKFFYKDSQVENASPVTVEAKDQFLRDVLNSVFAKTDLTYEITGNQIVIKQKPSSTVKKITGIVMDKGKMPIPGVGIIVPGTKKGTYTDENGEFALEIPLIDYNIVTFMMIGMRDLTLRLDTRTYYSVVMEESSVNLNEVIVTGIIDKRLESYTGAASSISSKELIRAGNKNVFESLKNIDPSIYIMDNLLSGSNPNALPGMEIRGTSSFPEESSIGISLKGNYGNIPNTPLFILDGFETSIERIMDMDMNRIESITILKDASAKALYGSKAANGVVVIETKKLTSGQLRISYNSSLDIEVPDLSSYNLMNSAEKLEAERIYGLYTQNTSYTPNYVTQRTLDQQYNRRLATVLSGVSTDWLSKPLRNGVGQKHGLSIELGEKDLKAIADFSYNDIAGVMKGSSRKTLSTSIALSYRYKKFLFRNILSVTGVNSNESPYGSFGDYSKMNPYWTPYDEFGNLKKNAETGIIT